MDVALSSTAAAAVMAPGPNAMVWFRKALRIHDNPALSYAVAAAAGGGPRPRHLFPVFVLDPHYLAPDCSALTPGSSRAGLNRIRFLLDSLVDLNSSLHRLGSRLILLRTDGRSDTADVICKALKDWNIGKLYFELDTEPYSLARDKKVQDFAGASGIELISPVSHTLFDPREVIEKNGGRPPLTYQSFVSLAGKPNEPLLVTYNDLPPIGDTCGYELLSIPQIEELGYGDINKEEPTPFKGGETEALRRLKDALSDKEWVAKFEKPKGDPSVFLKPATTVLSPYLKFGCLSARYFYKCIDDIYKNVKKHTSPPVSLIGQLLWRDFFYTVSYGTPNFGQMKGNPICKQIPWRDDEELLSAWSEGRTGYPWIDAIMMQLRKWGWMHHLARHSVACFLTRGDLFVHWEKGRDVFERLLIDSDWAINNGNWMWLSCSSFFYQYYRIYSPISFGKKYDPDGKFIRHFLPVLKDMPREYIYEPWTAPLSVQTKANCIIGKDYPKPGFPVAEPRFYLAFRSTFSCIVFSACIAVVQHDAASKECRAKMAEAYASKPARDIRGAKRSSTAAAQRKKQRVK